MLRLRDSFPRSRSFLSYSTIPILSRLIKRQPSLPLTNLNRFRVPFQSHYWRRKMICCIVLDSPGSSFHGQNLANQFLIATFFLFSFLLQSFVPFDTLRLKPGTFRAIAGMRLTSRMDSGRWMLSPESIYESDRERWIKVERSYFNEQIVCPFLFAHAPISSSHLFYVIPDKKK